MRKPRKLSAKLVGVQVFFLAVALVSIGFTLFVSWRLEGSAAAINDAGSLRMRTYRLAYLARGLEERAPAGSESGARDRELIGTETRDFEKVLAGLRRGDPARPLFVPGTTPIREQFAVVDREWASLEPELLAVAAGASAPVERPRVERFVGVVNELVARLEHDIARTTDLLRTIQLALVALAIAGATALIYLSFLFIIRPLHRIEDGLNRVARGEHAARVPVETGDEFGALARGFNHMAEQIEESYRTLETRVEQKTRSLAEQNARLATLYDMTAFLNAPGSVEDLCRGFLRRLIAATGAAAGAVRLVSRNDECLHLYVDEGLPAAFRESERCLARGECACGGAAVGNSAVIHVLGGRRVPITVTLPHCREAGFGMVAAFPVSAQRQLIGIYNLFFQEAREVASEERHMLESLGKHLGVAIENVRLVSRERELAASEERGLLARELHDSIAQSLAFLNLQVQMLRRALPGAAEGAEAGAILDEIQEGVQESYADVRELLVHFRTPTSEGDVEHGMRTLLARFERQTGVPVILKASGSALPIGPDEQLQVMHILQEALSNVRKHAAATAVRVELQRAGGYRFVVRDDGRGFDASRELPEAAEHVGLRIMRERAQLIGATLEVRSSPGRGTEVALTLPVAQRAAA
ncbi:MAG TPA: type IV pili methyl-accepting chemotaxis transducer N-terminal domain-containing protein [Usitatibacter sp.]|nr:type IV pili methyl-accepting chemotaxis transducer N-terminal domain-containing protein [Usitatibacter sp.]